MEKLAAEMDGWCNERIAMPIARSIGLVTVSFAIERPTDIALRQQLRSAMASIEAVRVDAMPWNRSLKHVPGGWRDKKSYEIFSYGGPLYNSIWVV